MPNKPHDAERWPATLTMVFRWSAVAGAFAILTWAFVGSYFRDIEGALNGRVCMPVATAVALLIMGGTVGSRWFRFAGWLSVAIIGQAAALQTIDAGQKAAYQHYRLPHQLFSDEYLILLLLLIVLAVQTTMIVVSCLCRWRMIRDWLAQSSANLRLLGVIILVSLLSTPVHGNGPHYLAELPFATFIQIINLATIIIMAASIPQKDLSRVRRWLTHIFGPESTSVPQSNKRVDRFAIAGAIWVTVITAALAFFSYERHPHISDEVSYVLQARQVASGSLATPAPPVPEAFELDWMHVQGDRWFAANPAGYPILLSVGVLAGVPWLVNPLLAGLNVILVSCLIHQLYDRRMSRLVVLLLCVSPWALFLGMSFMNHTLALTCAMFAVLCVERSRRSGSVVSSFTAGIFIGLLSLVRPLDALIVGILMGLWGLALGASRLKTKALFGLVLGTAIVGSLNFPYNAHLTGRAMKTPVMAFHDMKFGPNANKLGFGPNRGAPWRHLDLYPGHGPRDVVINTNMNLFSVNTELCGWSIGSLILVTAFVLLGGWQRNDRLMLAVIGAVIVTYSFYWFSGGPDFGARYWYLIIIPCLVLTARGIESLTRCLGPKDVCREDVGVRLMIALLALCLMTVINYIPWRALDKYHRYAGMRPDIRQLAEKYQFGRSLVLVRGRNRPDYASAAVYNPLDFQADVPIYAWDHDEQTRLQVLRSYPDRPVWIVNGPTVTGRGFEVEAGPLQPGKLNLKSAPLSHPAHLEVHGDFGNDVTVQALDH